MQLGETRSLEEPRFVTSVVAPLRRDPLLVAMSGWSVLYVLVCVWFTRRGVPVPPDSIQYAEVARSLLEGDGYTINMVAIHPGFLPQIRHPPELHGLLQPILLAPWFWMFGPEPSLVRIPGLISLACLGLVVFVTARRLFGPVAGLAAAVLLFAHNHLLMHALYGSDDVPFALFAFAALASFLAAASSEQRRWWIIAGACALLATLAKFVGAVLPAVMLFALFVEGRLRKFRTLRGWAWVAGLTAVAASAYTFRNYVVYARFRYRFSPIDWLWRDDPRALFTLYEAAPTFADVRAQLGQARLNELVLEQVRLLGLVLEHDWPWMILGPIALLFVCARSLFVLGAVAYCLALIFVTCIAHHVEGRYLFSLLPIYAVAVGGLAQRVADALARRGSAAQWHSVAVASLAAVGVLAGHRIVHVGRGVSGISAIGAVPHPCQDAAAFMKRAVPPLAPVLTPDPWFVAWHARRPAINAPTNGTGAVVRTIDNYKTEWAVAGLSTTFGANMQRIIDELRAHPDWPQPEPAYKGKQCVVYRLERRARESVAER